jgi:hypothetical protein
METLWAILLLGARGVIGRQTKVCVQVSCGQLSVFSIIFQFHFAFRFGHGL